MSMEAVSSARADAVGKPKAVGASGALLRNMVKANLDVDDNEKAEEDRVGYALTDRELISDMFMFFTAGYETTANTMSSVCAVLALYPDIQQKVFEETKSLWPNGTPTGIDEVDYKQTFSSLVLHLNLLFSSVQGIAEVVAHNLATGTRCDQRHRAQILSPECK
ncbi:hypothetical protein D9758_006230 [Tetrapyrgos nigripes]|uniref:Cytochrome P450 n=1 Tax=Tetrapyrgos nigripes TaxID=182062 RepID=A0A8H5GAN6_9AGAR|nr:hypothetical protein D9758_006230 [Tetrapyrgos nigripes]